MMNTALTQSAILIFWIILGYVLKRVGLFRQEDSKVLSNIMLYVTLPAVLVNAFRSFTLDVHLFSFVLLGLLANVILLVVGWKVGARETPLVHAMYMICLAGYNIGSFSIPFVQNLFPHRMMEVVLFDIGNSIINCGVSYSFARMQMVPGSRFQPWSMVKTLFSTYPFNLYIVLLALSLMHVSFPEPLRMIAFCRISTKYSKMDHKRNETAAARRPEKRDCTSFPFRQLTGCRPLPSSTAMVWNRTENPPQPAQAAARMNPARFGVSRGTREKSSTVPVRAAPASPPKARKGVAST